MTLLISICVGLYGLLVLALTSGFRRLGTFTPIDSPAQRSFSILVAFRNEAENLKNLVENLENLEYPNDKFEVLLIDDDSEDDSLEVANILKEEHPNLNLRILSNRPGSLSPKKEAVEKGVREANNDWIMTTDADCSLDPDHLRAYDQFLEKNSSTFVAGPVICSSDGSFLKRFQVLDFLSLQGATMGSFGAKTLGSLIRPFMCTGANLCYRKDAFLALNGYEGSRHIASGDDVFLLEKMLAHDPERVHFIKSRVATVRTQSEDSWKGLVEQRKRWAAKTSSYTNGFGKTVAVLVLLANLSLVIGFAFALASALPWAHFGMLFLIKINVDFMLLYNASLFFEEREALKSYVSSSLLYPLFSVLIAFLALNGSYRWKGRSFRK